MFGNTNLVLALLSRALAHW